MGVKPGDRIRLTVDLDLAAGLRAGRIGEVELVLYDDCAVTRFDNGRSEPTTTGVYPGEYEVVNRG